MPQVASEAPAHAFEPALRNPARAAPSSERTGGSPFDSLIDDGSQTPASPPPQQSPASADQTAAQPDLAQPPAKTKGANAAQPDGNSTGAKAGDTANAANITEAGGAGGADATVINIKVPGDGKVKPDARLFEPAKIGDKIGDKTGDDFKPAGDASDQTQVTPPTQVAPAAAPATAIVQTPTPTLAVAVAVAPAPAAVVPAAADAVPQAAPVAPAQAAPAALVQTVAAAALPTLAAAKTPKTHAVDNAAPRVDSGMPADDPKSAKAAFDLQGDGKPQPVAGDADKPAAAHPHDEVTATTHHASVETSASVPTDSLAAAPKTTGDVIQQVTLPPQPQDVSSAPANPAAPAPLMAQPAAVPLAGVAVEISGMALAGKNHFEIRLDPPELGRIEVRLNVDRDGHVTSRLIADRSDTLDLLRRDATGLERALQDAGLKTADNGLQFSLRDQTMGRQQSNQQSSMPAPAVAQIVVNDSALPVDAAQRNYSRLAGLRGGIDIRV